MKIIEVRLIGASYKTTLKDHRKFLRKYGLVEISPHFKNRFRISDNDKMYLRYHFHSFWKFVIPTAISIIALFGGYDDGIETVNHILNREYKIAEQISLNVDYGNVTLTDDSRCMGRVIDKFSEK